MEGELADHEDVAKGVEHGAVHHAPVVVEDAQVHNLVRQPVDVFAAVAVFYAHQDEHPAADGGLLPAIDGDGGVCGALDDGSHFVSV